MSVDDQTELIEEANGEEEHQRSWWDSWKELESFPNKKRFIILSIVITIIELAGFMVFAYAFSTEQFEGGLFDFGLLIMAAFSGLIISYIVTNKKEALITSATNGAISIIIAVIIYTLTTKYLANPESLEIDFYYFGIPIVSLLVQMVIAFTVTRTRQLYYRYEKTGGKPLKRDEEMIKELE
ncbi:MAG: hypothetical protein FK734_13585, partial [Asgard group archaeon]|nr:hypothetical protein [Asgard group archaeon]